MKPVFLILVLFAAVFAGAESRSPASQMKTAEKGGVTVSVIPLNLAETGTASIDFQLTLDTHAGALPSDMRTFAKLIVGGGAEIAPTAWSGGKGGHHLSGTLSFPAIATGERGSVTLVLKGAGARNDMRFGWDFPSRSAGNSPGGAG